MPRGPHVETERDASPCLGESAKGFNTEPRCCSREPRRSPSTLFSTSVRIHAVPPPWRSAARRRLRLARALECSPMVTSYRPPTESAPPTEAARAKVLDLRARRKIPVRHVRAPVPIHFPEEADVPEGFTHLVVRTFLFQLLRFVLGDEHTTGSEQFVYWNARDARRSLSPDVFVKLDRPQEAFGSWKTWERGGALDLAVEIISPNEGDGVTWDEKLARYHEAGITELVRFDPEAREGARLRAWDRVEGDLVEREVVADTTPCQTLGLVWGVRSIKDAPVAVRLLDAQGELVLDAREVETKGRMNAEARIRELEEELRRRG